jgi:hypothetical protein
MQRTTVKIHLRIRVSTLCVYFSFFISKQQKKTQEVRCEQLEQSAISSGQRCSGGGFTSAPKCPSDAAVSWTAFVALGAALVRSGLAVAWVLRVGLDVLGEVVAAHKTFVTDGARESLLTGVRAKVALQFVAAREPLPAKKPIAHERPLSGVPPVDHNKS